MVLSCLGALVALADPTPPIMPQITETPLPPAVTLPAPDKATKDVPNTPLTAAEAAQIALHHQPSIAIATAGLAAAQGLQTQAVSGLRPTISVGASYTANPIIASGGGAQPAISASASVRQLLFDFDHTRNLVRQTNAQTQSASANLSRAQSDLIFQTKQAFYQYAQNSRLIDINLANLRNQQSHLAMAQARTKAGLGLPVDVVRAQTAVSDAIFNLNLSQNTASVSKVLLTLLMGIDPRTPIQVADSSEPPIAADDVNVLVATALQQRPDLLQAQANVLSNQYGVSAAKTSNSPALVGSAGWGDRGDNFMPANFSLNYGVAIQWNAFDAGLTTGKVKTAQANLQSSQSQLDATRLSVMTDVAQAYLNLKTAEQRVVTSDAEIANAQEGVNLTQGRYNAGLGTFLDVLDAQTALVNAQTNRVNALSAVNQARAALAHAISADALYLQQRGNK